MNRKIDRLNPRVNKGVLIFLSGAVWVAVGMMLLILAFGWLHGSQSHYTYLFAGAGVLASLVIHHFGFLKIVDKNLGRILPIQGKRCVFSFMPWKSYLIVIVMVNLGIFLRHSPIPKTYLSVLYVGIGLSLILSSIRYFRVLIKELN